MMRDTGQNLHESSKRICSLQNHNVILADGTTVSLPVTYENQEAFPLSSSQEPGIGFPIIRMVGLISLSAGSVLDLALGPYQGFDPGEHALLRQMLDTLLLCSVLLADKYYCS